MTEMWAGARPVSDHRDPWDLARCLPLGGLILVLLLRCRFGLDVTDEMQYQGQILGLVESGRLFSTDLFIQQLVYLLFLPFYQLHHWLFGEVGLVLFGRLLLAASLLGLYAFSRRSLLDWHASRWQAGLAALAITFAVPFHGIFALSYNTVSQCAWVVFLFWYLEPSRVSPWRWMLLMAVAGLAHPVAAVIMATLLLAALLRSERRVAWFAWLTPLVVVGASTVAVVLAHASWGHLQEALVFSRGFGVGGHAVWSHLPSRYSALAYVVVLAVVLWLPVKRSWYPALGAVVLLGLCGFMIWAGKHLIRGHWSYGYTTELTQVVAVLAAGACLLAKLWPVVDGPVHATLLRRLFVVSGAHFLVLVGTSSNGLAQGLGALMVTVPVALALMSARLGRQVPGLEAVAVMPSLLVLVLAAMHWSVAPYRDQPWFRGARGEIDVPAFRFLSVSSPNLSLLQAYRSAFERELSGRPALIASERPGLYLALAARPQTCMLYMHSSGDEASSAALARCLDSRRPDVILDIVGHAPDGAATPLRQIMLDQASKRGMACQEGALDEHWIHAPVDAPDVRYRLCKTSMSIAPGFQEEALR
jgi:hypothetical protein